MTVSVLAPNQGQILVKGENMRFGFRPNGESHEPVRLEASLVDALVAATKEYGLSPGCTLCVVTGDTLALFEVTERMRAFYLWNVERAVARLADLDYPRIDGLNALLQLRLEQVGGKLTEGEFKEFLLPEHHLLDEWSSGRISRMTDAKRQAQREARILWELLSSLVIGGRLNHLRRDAWDYVSDAERAEADQKLYQLLSNVSLSKEVRNIFEEYEPLSVEL